MRQIGFNSAKFTQVIKDDRVKSQLALIHYAALFHLDYTTIYHLEQGKSPSLKTFFIICEVLQLNMYDFYIFGPECEDY